MPRPLVHQKRESGTIGRRYRRYLGIRWCCKRLLPARFGQFCYRTGEPEVIGSSIALVLLNAPVLTDLANFRVVGNLEASARTYFAE